MKRVCVYAAATSLWHVHLDNLLRNIFQTIREKSLNRKRLLVIDVEPGHRVLFVDIEHLAHSKNERKQKEE